MFHSRRTWSTNGIGSPCGSRAAFTVLELIIAIAVIAVLAGLSTPRMLRLLKEQRLKDDTEQVRQLLDRARVQAIEKGIAFQFRYEPEGRRFTLLPYELTEPVNPGQSGGAFATGGGVAGTGQPGSVAQSTAYPVFELSEECRFFTPSSLSGPTIVTEQLPQHFMDMLRGGASLGDVSWAPPIVYYPNGTATNGRVLVIDDAKRFLELSVRDLTGTVSVSPIQHQRGMFDGL